MKIISFDIGLKTCSVAIEEYPDPSLNNDWDEYKLPNNPNVKYLKGGECTTEFGAYIDAVGAIGKILWLEKRELGDKKAFFAYAAYKNLYRWCEDLSEHLSTADIILIEQQMKCNNIALALMYHLQAYLLIHFPELRVVLYPSKNKTRVLGAPLKVVNDLGKLSKVTKYQRKKWSTECAEKLLKARIESDVSQATWYDYIFKLNKSKKDDLSDVLMQSLSYVIKQKCKLS